MKDETISWMQLRNLAPLFGMLVTIIVTFMTLSSKVELLNQKMDLLLASQTDVVQKLVTKVDSLVFELKEYDLAINEMKIKVGLK